MFIPSLEYRKFLQQPRTPAEKKRKLTELAVKDGSLHERDVPVRFLEKEILADYANGVDILDPDLFTKADIEEFARENGIVDDPLVKAFIERARAEW